MAKKPWYDWTFSGMQSFPFAPRNRDLNDFDRPFSSEYRDCLDYPRIMVYHNSCCHCVVGQRDDLVVKLLFILFAPGPHGIQNGLQALAQFRQRILYSRRHFGIDLTVNKSICLHPPAAGGCRTGGQPGRDAHKWLFQTYACSMVLFRDRKHLAVFTVLTRNISGMPPQRMERSTIGNGALN